MIERIKGLWMVCLVGLFFTGFMVKAEANAIQFTMDAELPDNQIDQNKTYFDLLVEPGMEQELSIVLTNKSDEKLDLSVKLTTAVTNSHGIVDYTVVDPEFDDSLLHPFSEMATADATSVTLEAKEQKKVTLKLSVPKEPFDGIILGGVYVKQKNTSKAENIETQQAMVKAVSLRMNSDQVPLDMKLIGAQTGKQGYRNVFQAIIQNPQATLMDGITIEAQVLKEDDQIVFENKTEGIHMAPNSNFAYAIPLDQQLFEAGDYTMKINASANGEVWEFEEAFNVSILEAKELNNQQADETHEKTTKFGVFGGILTSVLALLIGGYMLYRNKHNGSKSK